MSNWWAPAGLGVRARMGVAIVGLALVAGAAHARADLTRGLELYEQGQMGEAFQILNDLALDGQPDALLRAGIMLQDGLGVAPDPVRAVQYLERAAGLGLAEAQQRLGQALLHGQGVNADPVAAREWLALARAQGESEASVDLAEIYRRGLGVERDLVRALDLLSEAMDAGSARARQILTQTYEDARQGILDDATRQWFERAAGEGDANTQAQLAYLYASGAGGLERDETRATELYEQAARQGHSGAQLNLAYRFHTAHSDQQQLANAIAWYQEAAESGQPEAQNNLGLAYLLGQDVERDPARAVEWFERALAQGNAQAENNLGLMLYQGDGVQRDPPQAIALLAQAASKGLPEAQTNLGYVHLDEDHPDADPAVAARWFRLAAEQDYPPAQGNLGYLYQAGRGVVRDYARALALYHRSAARDYLYAQRNLGQTYHYGIGTRVDLAEAVRWYLKAEAQGDEISARAIELICSMQVVPGCRGEVVVLLREEDGRIGKVFVQADDGSSVLLDSDFSTSRLGASGAASSVQSRRQDVEAIFADVLAEMPPEPLKIVVYFEDGNAQLTPASQPELERTLIRITRELASRETVEVDVVGHTDRVGESMDNDLLSQRRSQRIRQRLLQTGIEPQRLGSFWRGERAPAVKTPDGVREPRNRRVEIFVR